jgi:2-Cys peroxiredoxin 5
LSNSPISHVADPSFTPTCSSQVPGFIADVEKFAAKGVDGIYIVSVNDLWVVNAWKKSLNAGDKIKFGK